MSTSIDLTHNWFYFYFKTTMFHKMEEYVTINQPYGGNIDSGDEAQIIVANLRAKNIKNKR